MTAMSPDSARRRWRLPGPPDNEVPHGVPVHSLLGQGPDAAVFLTAAQAYSSGVSLWMALRLRRRFDDDQSSIHTQLMGFEPRHNRAADADGRLMLGVQLSDGRHAVMTSWRPPSAEAAPADPDAAALVSTPGGAFGDIAFDVRFWLTPLPGPGPLLIVIRWLALGIPETSTELDGSAINTAGASAAALWPPVPVEELEPPTPPPPPATGWFAEDQ